MTSETPSSSARRRTLSWLVPSIVASVLRPIPVIGCSRISASSDGVKFLLYCLLFIRLGIAGNYTWQSVAERLFTLEDHPAEIHFSQSYGYARVRRGGWPTRDCSVGVSRQFARPNPSVSLVCREQFPSGRSRRHLQG